jgi:hypothetical protein
MHAFSPPNNSQCSHNHSTSRTSRLSQSEVPPSSCPVYRSSIPIKRIPLIILMLQRNFLQLPKPPDFFLRQPARRNRRGRTLSHRPPTLRQSRRRPRSSARARTPPLILLLRPFPIALAQSRQHRKPQLHFSAQRLRMSSCASASLRLLLQGAGRI